MRITFVVLPLLIALLVANAEENFVRGRHLSQPQTTTVTASDQSEGGFAFASGTTSVETPPPAAPVASPATVTPPVASPATVTPPVASPATVTPPARGGKKIYHKDAPTKPVVPPPPSPVKSSPPHVPSSSVVLPPPSSPVKSSPPHVPSSSVVLPPPSSPVKSSPPHVPSSSVVLPPPSPSKATSPSPKVTQPSPCSKKRTFATFTRKGYVRVSYSSLNLHACCIKCEDDANCNSYYYSSYFKKCFAFSHSTFG